jgi:hypothetical protein
MSNELRDQIYNNMNLKETEELLEIWQTNDRVEWADSTFDVIKELLVKRGVEIPEQDDPIHEYDEEETEVENYDFSELELKIMDDGNPPDFYDPFEVLKLSKWIEWAAKAMVVGIIVYNLTRFPGFKNIVEAFFSQDPNSLLINIIAFVFLAINTITGIAISYFLLMTLAQALIILMQMEFNSRKAKA